MSLLACIKRNILAAVILALTLPCAAFAEEVPRADIPPPAVPVKKAIYPCKPGEVSLMENLECVGLGKQGVWVDRKTKEPQACKPGDRYAGGPEKFYICKGKKGDSMWVPDRERIKAFEERSDEDYRSWTGKHLVRRNETYEGGKPVIYESSLPSPSVVIEMYQNYKMSPDSDTLVIVLNEDGDIIIAGYGEVINSQ